MNKYKQLIQRTVKLAVVAVIIVGAVAGIYTGISMYAASVEKTKGEAEAKLNKDKGTLTTLRDQLNKSGAAEKRYAELVEARTAQEFSGKLDDLSAWLRGARDRYRLKMGQSNQGSQFTSEKPELLNYPYNFSVRSHATMEMQAISDMHVLSFADDMKRSAPGLVRIESITIKRVSEMSDASIDSLRTGSSTPLLVDAKIEFSLIGLQLKPVTATPEAQGK